MCKYPGSRADHSVPNRNLAAGKTRGRALPERTAREFEKAIDSSKYLDDKETGRFTISVGSSFCLSVCLYISLSLSFFLDPPKRLIPLCHSVLFLFCFCRYACVRHWSTSRITDSSRDSKSCDGTKLGNQNQHIASLSLSFSW